jgi:hypothetical protein
MKTNRSIISLMVVAVAALFVFAMAMPVMAADYGTFEGTITPQGQLMTTNGAQYWLNGHQANGMERHVGQKVEIKGLLRDRGSSNNFSYYYRSPSIEVYSYKLMNGMKSEANAEGLYPY